MTNLKIVTEKNTPDARGGENLLINPFSVYIVNPDKITRARRRTSQPRSASSTSSPRRRSRRRSTTYPTSDRPGVPRRRVPALTLTTPRAADGERRRARDDRQNLANKHARHAGPSSRDARPAAAVDRQRRDAGPNAGAPQRAPTPPAQRVASATIADRPTTGSRAGLPGAELERVQPQHAGPRRRHASRRRPHRRPLVDRTAPRLHRRCSGAEAWRSRQRGRQRQSEVLRVVKLVRTEGTCARCRPQGPHGAREASRAGGDAAQPRAARGDVPHRAAHDRSQKKHAPRTASAGSRQTRPRRD